LSASRTGWGVTKLSPTTFRVVGGNESSIVVDFSPPGLSANTWNHLALTRSGSVFTVYWNGAAIASASSTIDVNSPSSLKLGHRGAPGDTPGSTDTRGFFLN